MTTLVEWEEHVSRKRMIRLMQEEGLKARVRKRYKGTTMSDHDQPVADNLLQQEFTAERPNQRWVGDTSELRIGENGKALPGGRARPVLSVRRRVGGQRRQRPPSDHQGPRHGREAALPGRSACCITRIRVRRMPARTTESLRFHHVAGTGEQGYSGDGGQARLARLGGPKGLAWSRDLLYVADTENHAIREISLTTGLIRTVLGTGQRGDGPEPDPHRCALARPHGVLVDARGVLYVGDSEAHRIRTLS